MILSRVMEWVRSVWLVLLLASMAAAQSNSAPPAESSGAAQADAKNSAPTQSAEKTSAEKTKPKTDNSQLAPGEDPNNRLLVPFLGHIVGDQKQFWTSPANWGKKDLKWTLPLAGMTGGLIAGDHWITQQVPDKPNQLNRSANISDYTTYALIAGGGGSFLLGAMRHDEHMQEAGLLGGEAAINATGVTYLLKGITQRPRPLQGNGKGTFFTGGYSFTSEHSAIAWSIASVFAHEYPGWLSQFLAYGAASTVTVTRLTAKQHFSSDVVVGSILGWYFGRQVYRAHHDADLPGAAWGNFYDLEPEEKPRNPDYMSSPYVPMDSWIYPALDRLIAEGYVTTGFLNMRPWTRLACARMVDEAGDVLGNADSPETAQSVYRELSQEFADETARLNGARNLGARVESVYTRVMNISGPALRDGYHFAQTVTNDFGRPFGNGVNLVSGVSASAVAGPFSFYVRGEYQHAPSVDPVSQTTLQAMASADFLPSFGPGYFPPGYSVYTGAYNRFRLLEGTVNLTLANVQMSFGKQSVWLGPGNAGPLQFSDNATPVVMLRIDNVNEFHFPLLSSIFGPARMEFFLGQLDGHQWVFQPPTLYGPNNVNPQPYLHGEKFSFHPTKNLEFGMSLTAMFSGPGLPFTFHNFLRTYYAHTSHLATNPGKRFSAADFSYRIPHLRDWLTGYVDSLVVDEYSPLGSTRASLHPGLYMPRVPRIPKLEIRAEGVLTAHPDSGSCCDPGYVYADQRYISGYTNDSNLIGNWIGRDGKGGQGWATYNFSPRTMVQFGYRNQHVDQEFLKGGNLSDFTFKSNVTLRDQLTMTAQLQYERWNFQLLSATAQNNFLASFGVTYWPKWKVH